MKPRMRQGPQLGATMIEVLVTLLIVSFGLLGMAGLQMRLQLSEVEAYQRTQALMLMNDMASRIAENRRSAASYVSGATYGPVGTCPTSSGNTVQRDLRDWCGALQGSAESKTIGGVKTFQGAMIGARGCIQQVGLDYMVSVAWQGATPISAPPSSVTCGANLYDSIGTRCVNDLCRRVITTLVRIGTL